MKKLFLIKAGDESIICLVQAENVKAALKIANRQMKEEGSLLERSQEADFEFTEKYIKEFIIKPEDECLIYMDAYSF